jgi:hypothetical protein
VRSWLDSGEIDLIQGMAFSVERALVMNLSEAHAQNLESAVCAQGLADQDSQGYFE